MDIAGVSMAMSQSKVNNQASIQLMKIAMDTGKENAASMTQMLQQAVNPNVGQHLDVRV